MDTITMKGKIIISREAFFKLKKAWKKHPLVIDVLEEIQSKAKEEKEEEQYKNEKEKQQQK